jgi:hypothetical protein
MGRRPFLKRYLRRGEIAFTISSCDAALNDALGTFGVGLPLRSGAFELTCLTSTAVHPNSHAQANPGQRVTATKRNPGFTRDTLTSIRPSVFTTIYHRTNYYTLVTPCGLPERPKDTPCIAICAE